MHAFWKEREPQNVQIQMERFMKNVSLAGGALVIFWVYNQLQDLPFSLTEPLLNPW